MNLIHALILSLFFYQCIAAVHIEAVEVSCITNFITGGDPEGVCNADIDDGECGEESNPCHVSMKDASEDECGTCLKLTNGDTTINAQIIGSIAAGTGTIPDYKYFLSATGFEALNGSPATRCYQALLPPSVITGVIEGEATCPTPPEPEIEVSCILDYGNGGDPEEVCEIDLVGGLCGVDVTDPPCLVTMKDATEDECGKCLKMTYKDVSIHTEIAGGIKAGTGLIPDHLYFLSFLGFSTLNNGTAPSRCWAGLQRPEFMTGVEVEEEECYVPPPTTSRLPGVVDVSCISNYNSNADPDDECSIEVDGGTCGEAEKPCHVTMYNAETTDCGRCMRLISDDVTIHAKVVGGISTGIGDIPPYKYFMSAVGFKALNNDEAPERCYGGISPDLSHMEAEDIDEECFVVEETTTPAAAEQTTTGSSGAPPRKIALATGGAAVALGLSVAAF